MAARASALGPSAKLMLLSPFERRQFGTPAAFGFDGYLVKPIRERSLVARLFEPDARNPPKGERGAGSEPALRTRAGLRVLLAENAPSADWKEAGSCGDAGGATKNVLRLILLPANLAN